MISEKFRYQLRQEANKWLDEGLIDSETYNLLAYRYQFENLDRVSRNRFVIVVISLGFILLGLAIITFVAANWQGLSRLLKVWLLLSWFVGANVGGFYLWREGNDDGKSRLGHGLLLLGTLSLGANMGLMSQMFHQTGKVASLYFIWGLLVLIMAYSLRLTSLGLVALILIALAYGSGLSWFRWTELEQYIQQMPLIAALLFIPLAKQCRSRWLFGLSLVFITVSLEVNLIYYLDIPNQPFKGLVAAIASIIPAAYLWGYRDSLWLERRSFSVVFESISRKLAFFYLGLFFYIFSFHGWWEKRPFYSSDSIEYWQHWSFLIPPIILLFLSIWSWWKLGQRHTSNASCQGDHDTILVGIMLLTTATLVWVHYFHALNGLATIMFNLMLFLLSIGLMRQSVTVGKRFGFWLGIILISLQLFSRMFEYDTSLLFKAIVLFGCGIAVIVAGLLFERYLRTNF